MAGLAPVLRSRFKETDGDTTETHVRAARRRRRALAATLAVCLGVTVTVADSRPNSSADGRTSEGVPEWAADALWYQVYVARFCNGSAANDPPATRSWRHDWAKLEADERPPLRTRLFYRRYGGDLQGLRSRLGYLADLGVNALYLNPIFQADDEHKYDTADHRHVDDSFAIARSRRALSGETADPSTWQWSQSDRCFLDLVADAHARGIRVMLDGVFNHVGPSFWAWRDVQVRGRDSPYAGWFDVTHWGPPLRWRAWDGPNGNLVRFRRAGDGLHPEVEQYLFAVVRRWMDPDGDGDPRDGVDGWRLDAAEQVPHGFWRRFRALVKGINPAALIVGEIWEDASAWLNGDQFDVVTNYRFREPVVRFFGRNGPRREVTALAEELAAVRRAHPAEVTLAMLNLLGSHDTERVLSRLAQWQEPGTEDAGDASGGEPLQPEDEAVARLKLAVLVQFTYPGAPLIYYGDEVGMYGGNDPFCRAPMWWPQTHAPDYRPELLAYHKRLGRLRRQRIELRRGRFQLLLADDARRLLVFARRHGAHETIVLLNCDTRRHLVTLNLDGRTPSATGTSLSTTALTRGEAEGGASRIEVTEGRLRLRCAPLTGRLVLLDR